RHTRSKRDWSSDVCSSDLLARSDVGRTPLFHIVLRKKKEMLEPLLQRAQKIFGHDKELFLSFINAETKDGEREEMRYSTPLILEIGRASCRERVYIMVGAG